MWCVRSCRCIAGRLSECGACSAFVCLGDGGVFDRSKVGVGIVWALSKVVASRKTW